MRGKHAFPILLFLVSTAAYGQQLTLEGQVSIHNSQYRTGRIEFVEGAIVSAPSTTTQVSGKKGIFQLEFAGVDAGNPVTASVEKAGLEVVNTGALQGVAIGSEAPLRVFMAEKGWLEQEQKELLRSSIEALTTRQGALAASLRRGGEESRATVMELERWFARKIATRFEAEEILNEQQEELARRLPESIERLARINLDYASAHYQKAFEYFKQGKMVNAVAVLNGAELEKEAEAALASFLDWERKGKAKQAAEAREGVYQAVESCQLQALAHLLLFRYQDALNVHQKATTLLQRAGGEEDMALAEAYSAIALSHLLLTDMNRALHYQQQSVKIKERRLEPDSPELASAYHFLAEIYLGNEDYPMALEAQEKAISIRERALPTGHPGIAAAYAGLADIYTAWGEYPLALNARQQALRIQEQALAPNHPDIARSYHALAEAHRNEGAHLKALEAELKAIFILEQALPHNHPDIAKSYNSLALAYLKLGDYEKALAIQQKIIALQEQNLPAGHPDIAASYHSMVSTFYFLQDLDRALEYEQQAYAMLKEQFPPYHPRIKEVESSFAFLYTTRGDRREAAGKFQEAIQDFKNALEYQPDIPELRKRIRQMESGQSPRQTDNQEAFALNQRGKAGSVPAPQRANRIEQPKAAVPHSDYGFFQVTKATSLRERPTSSSSVLRRLAEGDRLQVIEKTEYYWWKVRDNGRTGYVKAQLLEEVK
ncbi:MAG: tetratricopeptide repeat protein [Phaeodactylibacter sp.]|nr:tetratricopeptide repeat protein [Phaeodactylibacter sp.]MCB9049101.1 tetratricopeptide repeat protein [Lewinellaceae bacterium]